MIFNFSKKKETLIFPNRKEVVGDGEGKYVGEVKNGKANGFGTLIYPHPNVPETEEGDKYIGEFKNNNFHGTGKFKSFTGYTYDGEWKNGKYHGKGIYIYSIDSLNHWPYEIKYIGEFKNGTQHGNGKIFILNGTFEGKFKNGEAAGKGDVIYSDGKKRVGPYKDLFFKDRFFK